MTINPTSFVATTFASYILTLLFTASEIFRPIRNWIYEVRRRWAYPYVFEECRLCVGFYMSTIAWLVAGPSHVIEWMGIYGASYWLTTREIPI